MVFRILTCNESHACDARLKEEDLPEPAIEHAEYRNTRCSQFERRNLGGVETGHGRNGEGVEALEEENHCNRSVDAGRILTLTEACRPVSVIH